MALSSQYVLVLNPFSMCTAPFICNKTKPSLDSEAGTKYKLKGQSSNMQTGQSFENKELVCLAGPSG